MDTQLLAGRLVRKVRRRPHNSTPNEVRGGRWNLTFVKLIGICSSEYS